MPVTINASGYIEVYRDGVFVSRHNVESNAIEAVIAHAELNGDGDYELRFPNKVVMSRLRKQVVPFSWNPITLAFVNGTAASVNLAGFLANPENRSVAYSVTGSLPAGVTLSGSTVAYNGTGAVASASVRFNASWGGLTATSSPSTVSINAAAPANRAPVFTVAPTTATIAATGGTIQFTATDPDADTLTYTLPTTRAGITINSGTGLVTVASSAAGTTGSITVRATDPSGAYAEASCAVTVQSVVQPPVGTIVHGQPYTITASQMGVASFGTKTTAAPLLWDDVSGASHLEKWSGAWPDVGNSAYYTQYRNVQRGVNPSHSRATRYIAGSHGDNAGYNAGYNVIPYRAFTAPAFPYYIYASWYQRSDPAWVFGGDNNFKIFDFSYGGTPYTMSSSTRSNWYVSFDGPYSTTAPTAGLLINDDGGSFINPDMNGHNYWWSSASNPMYGWAKVEVEARITNQNDGYLRVWDRSISGTPRVNYLGPTDRYDGTARAIGIGGYARMSGQPNNWRYFNDAYIDLSAARVVLANSANIDTATIVEPQPPTSWDTGSITFTGNLGRLSSGTAYLHVRNSSGAWVNATGYSVQVA